jgi:AcrR family transcriptional regulator
MPARDEEEFERKRQRIIDGALEVFASKGYERATNRDIAGAAGIGSPGLIYHYFDDKADLFRHVLEQRVPLLELVNRPEELLELPPREALPRFARAVLEMIENRTTAAVLQVMLSEAVRRPAVAEVLNAIGPRRGFALLARYLERQMAAGTLRRMDTGAAVRCFVGPLFVYLLTSRVFPQPDAGTLDAETMAGAAVEVFLRGLERGHEENG